MHKGEECQLISIHAPRTGSDGYPAGADGGACAFQSTLPARGATDKLADRSHSIVFQSTLPARGATRRQPQTDGVLLISIHAPRTGSDIDFAATHSRQGDISIHAPRTGSDSFCREARLLDLFQSTLPARGATRHQLPVFLPQTISIHAPRTGSDSLRDTVCALMRNFNPRSPHGERRSTSAISADSGDFNPRSPHGERHDSASAFCSLWHFNPRSPHGERPGTVYQPGYFLEFQSTLPARGATRGRAGLHLVQIDFNPRSPHGERQGKPLSDGNRHGISIHAPRTGSDPQRNPVPICTRYFNPRSPHGERPHRQPRKTRLHKKFQSTLPARGATGTALQLLFNGGYFNPRSPHGERREA